MEQNLDAYNDFIRMLSGAVDEMPAMTEEEFLKELKVMSPITASLIGIFGQDRYEKVVEKAAPIIVVYINDLRPYLAKCVTPNEEDMKSDDPSQATIDRIQLKLKSNASYFDQLMIEFIDPLDRMCALGLWFTVQSRLISNYKSMLARVAEKLRTFAKMIK